MRISTKAQGVLNTRISRRGFLGAMGAAALSSTLSSCSGSRAAGSSAKAEFDLVIAHATTTDHFTHRAYMLFADHINKGSEGRINARVFPNGVFGGDRQLIESVQLNNIQATAPSTSPLAAFSKNMNVWDLPFKFDSRDEAFTVLDGEFGQARLKELEDVQIVGLGYWENGFRNLTHKVKDLELPQGLKGLKVRTLENPTQIRAWNATGASATPMAFTEVYTGLQQGTIDAQENPLALIASQKFYEVQKYMVMSNHVYTPMPLLLSKKFFDELPLELQELVKEAGTLSTQYCREEAIKDEEKSKNAILEGGVEIRDISNHERDQMREIMSAAAEPYLRGLLGDQIIDDMNKAVEASRA